MRHTTPYRLLALALAAASAAGAQGAGPLPAALRWDDVQERVLPNGLRVLVRSLPASPVVSLQVFYRVGSRSDRAGGTGLSRLAERSLREDPAGPLFWNGAAFGSETARDWTRYHATLAPERLEAAVIAEAERMRGASPDPAILREEAAAALREAEGIRPEEALRQAVSDAAFDAHPYAWPVGGWPGDLRRLSPAAAAARRTHCGPASAVAVITGGIDAASALALVRRHFGPLARGPVPGRPTTPEPPQTGERRVLLRRAGAAPAAVLAYRVPAAAGADAPALAVIRWLLDGAPGSRLYRLVETGRAAAAAAELPRTRDPFLFFLSASGPAGAAPQELEAALLDEVERLKAEPPPAGEVARAVRRLEADLALRLDSASEQAALLGEWAMVDDWRSLRSWVPRVRALRPAQLQEAARRWLVAPGRTCGLLSPAEGAVNRGSPPARRRPRRRPDPGPPAPPVRLRPLAPTVSRHRLANGLELIVREHPGSPVVALRGGVPAGSLLDPPGKQGRAAVAAAMLLRGTGRRSAAGFAAALAEAGARVATRASPASLDFTAQAPRGELGALLELVAEMLREPAFPEAELEQVRREALAALEGEARDPWLLARRAFERALFPPQHPLRPPAMEAARSAIAGLTRADLLELHRAQFGPDRLILAVAGGAPAEEVREAVAGRLGAWPRNRATRPTPTPDVPLAAAPARVVVPAPAGAGGAIWGHAGGLRRVDPDYAAGRVVSLILEGRAGRGAGGASSWCSAGFDAGLYAGAFRIAEPRGGSAGVAAAAELSRRVGRLVREGVSRREVEQAAAALAGRLPVAIESSPGMAGALWEAAFFGLGPDFLRREAEALARLTPEDVNRAARAHLRPDRALVVIAGSPPQAPLTFGRARASQAQKAGAVPGGLRWQ